MLKLPSDGNAALATPELGGRKLIIFADPLEVGPWYFGAFEDKEATRNDKN
jgi:hypothetical protein